MPFLPPPRSAYGFDGAPLKSVDVGVGHPASFATFGSSALPTPADPRASLASGVGHPVRPVPDVRGADARRREDECTLTADERSEEADRKAAKKRVEQVDVCVDALTWQERAAIQRHMKAKRIGATNEACNAKVWSNPRALDVSDAHASYQAAKAVLYPYVSERGLLKVARGQ